MPSIPFQRNSLNLGRLDYDKSSERIRNIISCCLRKISYGPNKETESQFSDDSEIYMDMDE